ncbi:coproporphyrinogen III oxidase [Pontiella agarivorans]|uniref:coproporphyrinogen oxidase n=1 Tax=Pontiella agarivorans TaxID=3038953 RepID=A0ABU5N1K1_9BACT|nr:coproporphyrinogen III oxidase [Pontiella agarivorans]MDZ8120131.1 coproporphyrinogen III oxidase [Pontiella agarivorans]
MKTETKRTPAASVQAMHALEGVEALQTRFVQGLEKFGGENFQCLEWFRDDGRHGGGRRFGVQDAALLGRASVNVSQVHYDDEPERRLGAATAISTIVHPVDPFQPSVHIHISWTEMKSGRGYWRMMADLNPSVPIEENKERFARALQAAAPEQYEEAREQGDRYFFIPVLNRHRGITHFYLENWNSGDVEADSALAWRVGEAAIDAYLRILQENAAKGFQPSETERAAQLAYHTLYFFQVLTLDRGTTTGLMVHDQNDVGILGSLPPQVDKNLLLSWVSRMPDPQDRLLDRIIRALPNAGICTIDDAVKINLCRAVREHYRHYPEALDLQASGGFAPPTVDNHR